MNDLVSKMNNDKVKIGNFRWTIVAMIFLATTINYVDRQVIGILAPTLQKEIGWSEIEYGYIVTAFTAAYAIGLLIMGRLIDVIGTKIGYIFALTGWSFAAMGHALARTVFGFGFARFTLGIFEAGNFPAAIKTVAEWFPKKERAFATGLFNAGSNVGAIVAPLVVPWITITWGWQEAFIFTGAAGFLWLILWFWLYEKPEKHKRLSKKEMEYIQSDPPDTQVKIPWKQLLKYRGAWSFVVGKFLTDPAWWFYLYWIPSFLNKNYGITLTDIGIPLIIIYVMADVGSIGGGWLSSFFIKHGWSINKGRKVTMLICALTVVPIVFASQAAQP
jgi:ACS family hexuronate transporter-like MFS transporter